MQHRLQPGTFPAACVLAVFLAVIALHAPLPAVESSSSQEAESERAAIVAEFLSSYCLSCHDAATAEGQREFESLQLPLQSLQQLTTADQIIDQVTGKTMPPEDSQQPTDQERLELVTALRGSIELASRTIEGARASTVMRRLSHREYENSLAVLLDRRVDTLGLTAEFPPEQASRHLDNIGESLVTSGFLLDQYFRAANRLVELRLGKPAMKPQTWHFTDNFQQYEELTGAHKSVLNFEYLCLYEQPNTDTRQGGYGHIEDFLNGVPVSGLYEIQVHAQAMHRDTHYDPKIFGIDFSEPFQLAVVPGDATKGHIHYPQAIEPVLAQAVVPDDEPEWLRFEVWLEAGQTPRFTFPNGPYESRASVIEVNRRYKQEFEGKGYQPGVSRAHILRHGALPHIRIGEIKIHGPLEEPGGGREELAVFGRDGFQADQAIEQLCAFGQRAFRRPLAPEDRERIEAMYQKSLTDGSTPRQAALDTLKLILCSPSFLYLSEITPQDSPWLNPFDLASRLSYAIWAAPPDGELFAAAESGRLTEPAELKKQVLRMLDDDAAQQFVHGFVDSWLNLRDIGSLPPPRHASREYYAENLPASMKQEAYAFFQHLLDADGPATDLLDADYTFVDKKLAKLYGLPQQDTLRLADGFQRVSLAGNSQRGGVLGMAGVLTVSANGVDTSPVTRGVWVLENLLGIRLPPPPANVPALDADVSGATTIREKLAKHSEDPACYVCHKKMDPLGFALETFDPIGRWRERYPKPRGKAPGAKIDASGQLPTGELFDDFAGLKQALLAGRRNQFARHLVEQLLAYSTGRHVVPADRGEIDEILRRVEAQNYPLRTMVTEVLTSQAFRER